MANLGRRELPFHCDETKYIALCKAAGMSQQSCRIAADHDPSRLAHPERRCGEWDWDTRVSCLPDVTTPWSTLDFIKLHKLAEMD